MTPLETIKAFCENCEKEIKALNPIYSCPFAKEKKLCPQFQMVEKPLKALEIIKRKNVDIAWLLSSFEKNEDVSYYNHIYDADKYNYSRFNNQELTEEEFDLLKEVLK